MFTIDAYRKYRSIKRIIFESISKWNGHKFEYASTSTIKQIAGRAGRYRTAAQANENEVTAESSIKNGVPKSMRLPILSPAQNLGLITTLESMDLQQVRKAMQTEADPIMSAGIFPPTNIVLQFAAHYPTKTPFSFILLRLHELALKHPRFHLCVLKDQISIADAIEPIKDLTISDRVTFTAAPANMRNPKMYEVLQAMARCVANSRGGALLDIPEINLDVLDLEMTTEREYLSKLEDLHKALILYLWLSFRFTGVFTSHILTMHVKSLVEQKIDKVLSQVTYYKPRRDLSRTKRQKDLLRRFQVDGEDFDAKHGEQVIHSPAIQKYRNPTSTDVPVVGSYRVLEIPGMAGERPSTAAG